MKAIVIQGSFGLDNLAIELHSLRPVVDTVFPISEAREAFENMAAGKHFGKIVINVAD